MPIGTDLILNVVVLAFGLIITAGIAIHLYKLRCQLLDSLNFMDVETDDASDSYDVDTDSSSKGSVFSGETTTT